MEVYTPRDIYGYRARIGYTSPPAATEVFPYEFYMLVPQGVSLVVSTLAIVDMSKEEIDRSYEISLGAAHELARAGVDLVVLGGLPINRSRGSDVDGLIREVEDAIKTRVTTSTSAQMDAMRALGAKNIVIGHPFAADQNALFVKCLADYGLSSAAVQGAGFPADHLGRIPRSSAVSLARSLMKQAPQADTMWMPCPHWAVAESIEPIEKEFGINVVAAHQAIVWSALRHCQVNDKILGYGRLLQAF